MNKFKNLTVAVESKMVHNLADLFDDNPDSKMLIDRYKKKKRKVRIPRMNDVFIEDLAIDDVKPARGGGLVIYWHANIGWGQYVLYFDKGKGELHADTECMDINEDKAFTKLLLEKLIDQIVIDD